MLQVPSQCILRWCVRFCFWSLHIKGTMYRYSKFIIALSVPIMVVVIFVVLFLVLRTVEPDSVSCKQKLVIDHDGGADDALAIFMALLYEKYYNGSQVIALTTTHGNIDEEQVYINSQRILSVADRTEVPIYRGTAKALVEGIESDYFFGFDGLGDNPVESFQSIAAQKEHAALQLIELSKKYEGHLEIVALGALTNIALAIRLDPDFVSRLSQLYVAAGHVYDVTFQSSTRPEFNAAMDAESYHIVVANGTADKITLIPFSQILKYQNISKEWREDVLGSIPTKIMKAQNLFERISLNAKSYWSLLDPSAMAVALVEKTVVEETLYSNNGIILCGDYRGITTNNYTCEEGANARLIYKVKKEPYMEFLYNLFSKELFTD